MDGNAFLADHGIEPDGTFDASDYRVGRSRLVDVRLTYRHAPDAPRRTLEEGPRYLVAGDRVALHDAPSATTLVTDGETLTSTTATLYDEAVNELPVETGPGETTYAAVGEYLDVPRLDVMEHSYGVTLTGDETVQLRDGEATRFQLPAQTVDAAGEDDDRLLLVVPEVIATNHGFVDVYDADDGALVPLRGAVPDDYAADLLAAADEVLVDADRDMALARP